MDSQEVFNNLKKKIQPPFKGNVIISQQDLDKSRKFSIDMVYGSGHTKEQICPTLTANMGSGGHNVPLLLDNFGVRKLSVRECLRLQGFPESFNFPQKSANSNSYKQVGNSVPVTMIQRVAQEIFRSLDES